MGASSSSIYFNAYKSIVEVQNIIQKKKSLTFKVYLINTCSIKNFITIIKKNKILDHLNDDKKLKQLEKQLNKDLKKYQLEKNIVIFNQIEQYKQLIEDNNKSNEENEFILVDDTFIDTMKIDDKDKENKKIGINIDNGIKIKFIDCDKEISLLQKSAGFYSLDKINIENNKSDNNKEDKININNSQINNSNLQIKQKNEIQSEPSTEKGAFYEESHKEVNSIFGSGLGGINNHNIQNKIQIDSFKNQPLSFIIDIENTFCMNIQLLILSNIPQLTNYFLSHIEKFLNNNNKYKLAKAYSDIIYNLWNINNSDNSCTINNLKIMIGEDSKLFEPKFLVPILYETLNNELNENTGNSKFENIESDKTCAETEYYNFKESFNNKNKCIISDIFYFEQIIKSKCTKCKNEYYDFSMINNLTFDLEKIKITSNNNKNMNIFNCLDYLVNEYNNINICPYCNKSQNFKSIKSFNSLPEILTIILDYENNSKKDIKYDINDSIDLSKYLFNWNNYKKTISKFELIGLMNYVNENNGYFLGYYKSPVDNKWYLYNNLSSKISNVNNIKDNKGNPYLLIYKKTNC